MAASVNEDAHKKSTDCVFFLASPLTCEKGNDCEFRHSEIARNNPRDCWYWLSGSCLNANCAFRHPPLDAVPEGELAGGGRSRVPCYYFMQGFCARGDKCNFGHGLATASATEGSQKGSKPNVPKVEVSESQTSANKGNGSATSKCSFEAYDAIIETQSQKEDHVVKEVDLPVLPECSDSSALARSQLLEQANLSDQPKQASAIDVRLNQVHPSGEKFLQQETEPEDDQLCNFQPCNDGLGQDPSGEDLIQEGSESEEMWEESSFDVLVDDGGTDQLIYADEVEYLNSYDALVEHLARGTDGFIDFDYDHVSAYGQYHDAEYEELATYDAYEQQLLHEQLSSVDPEDHRQPIMALKNRHGKDLIPRVRRGMTFDGEARPQRLNVDSNDLRNHIVKRRRAEKNQNYGDDNDRRRHQDNGSHHNRRHRDGHFKQQEGPARRLMSPRSGSRSGRQYTGRGDFVGSRQFHERFELSGGKRPFRDLASDHEATGSERGSGKKIRAMNDTFKAKARKERGRPAITGVDEPLRSRGYQQTGKVESRKVDSSFTGPKSLAQIKAEKMKAIQERGLAQQHDGDIECNGTIEELHASPATDTKSKVSHCFYKERVSEGIVKHPKTMIPAEVDFEGPKPLSVILRQKRKGQREGNINDADEEDTEIKDKSWRAKDMHFQNTSGSGMRKSQLHNSVNTVSEPTNVRAYHPVDMQDNQLDRHVEPPLDVEDGLDVGDNLMEDIDFDDEDEDDFAEKLGGFLS